MFEKAESYWVAWFSIAIAIVAVVAAIFIGINNGNESMNRMRENCWSRNLNLIYVNQQYVCGTITITVP